MLPVLPVLVLNSPIIQKRWKITDTVLCWPVLLRYSLSELDILRWMDINVLNFLKRKNRNITLMKMLIIPFFNLQVVMLFSCILAFFLNYFIFLNTTLNSALTQTMCGNLKVDFAFLFSNFVLLFGAFYLLFF